MRVLPVFHQPLTSLSPTSKLEGERPIAKTGSELDAEKRPVPETLIRALGVRQGPPELDLICPGRRVVEFLLSMRPVTPVDTVWQLPST